MTHCFHWVELAAAGKKMVHACCWCGMERHRTYSHEKDPTHGTHARVQREVPVDESDYAPECTGAPGWHVADLAERLASLVLASDREWCWDVAQEVRLSARALRGRGRLCVYSGVVVTERLTRYPVE